MSGAVLPPLAWVDPTPIRTVERIATPGRAADLAHGVEERRGPTHRLGRDHGERGCLVRDHHLRHHPPDREHESPDVPQVRRHTYLGERQHAQREADQATGDVAAGADHG